MFNILESCNSSVPSISRAFDEFRRGREWGNGQSGLEASLLLRVAARLEDRTLPVMSLPRISFEKSLEASYQFGKLFGISEILVTEDGQLDAISRVAQILIRGVFEERDSARDLGADLFQKIAHEYIRLGRKNDAGMALTNSALAQLERFSVPKEELDNIHARLVRAQGMRDKGADWAYTEFQLGICERMQAQSSGYSMVTLAQSWRRFQRSKKAFAHSGGFPEEMWYVFGINLTETVECMEESLRRVHLKQLYGTHGDGIPDSLKESFNGRQIEMLEMLIVNPQACGLKETPGWLDQDFDLSSISGHIRDARDELSAASKYLSGEQRDQIWWLLNKMERLGKIRRGMKFNQLSKMALERTWARQDLQTYFARAITLIGAEIESGLEADYFELVENLTQCVDTVWENWSTEFVREFFKKHGLQLRFLACELADHCMWEESFRVLEMTRGVVLLSPGRESTANDNSNKACGGAKTDLVHLTHSPTHSAVVGKSASGEYFGKVFPEISGHRLSAIFSGLGEEKGLVTVLLTRPSGANREDLEGALNRVQEALVGVADFLSGESISDCLAIIPGGYYQVVPMGLYLNSEGMRLNECVGTSLMPSAWVAEKNRVAANSGELANTLNFVDASDVPGLAKLSYSPFEKLAVTKWGWVSRNVTPTRVDLLAALQNSGAALHYTGHSLASVNPHKSALALYGSSLTVRDILYAEKNVEYVFLSSCESGLSYNAFETEDFLSIQSSFIYGGAQAAIGTMWPVRDFTAFCFAARFYFELNLHPENEVGGWIAAHRNTQLWMRSVTAEKLIEFFAGFDENSEMVGRVRSLEGKDRIFESILDWGAFSVMGVS